MLTTDHGRPTTVYDMANLAAVCDDRGRAQPHAGPSSALRFVTGDPARTRQIRLGKLGNSQCQRALLHAFGNQPGSGNRCFVQTIFSDQVAWRSVSGVSGRAKFVRKGFSTVVDRKSTRL